jgi:hypothetical protein
VGPVDGGLATCLEAPIPSEVVSFGGRTMTFRGDGFEACCSRSRLHQSLIKPTVQSISTCEPGAVAVRLPLLLDK